MKNPLMRIKRHISSYFDKRYHHTNVKVSNRFIKKMTKDLPPLTRTEKRAVRQVYRPYHLKPNFHHLAFFKSCYGFSPYYISDNIYYGTILANINNDQRRKMDDKNYYDLLFPHAKMPKTILRRIKGLYLTADYEQISYDDARCIIEQTDDAIFKVSIESSGGESIIFKHAASGEDIAKYMQKNLDFIVQEVIEQHENLAAINQGSINTLRLMVIHFDDSWKVISTLLRSGKGNSGVDNFSKGGLIIPIDDQGQFGACGYDKYGKKYTVHPSGFVLSGHGIDQKQLDDVKQDVIRQAQTIPFMQISSWDYSLSPQNEPILIECNIWMGGQLDFHQMLYGPIFKDYFPYLLAKR